MSSNTDEMIERLCGDRPRLHVDGNRELADYGIDRRLAIFLRANVNGGQRTVETGSGLSTILFLLLGTEHTAVSPDPDEPTRIKSYCKQNDISLGRYHPIVGRSEDVLPTMVESEKYDLALVDGNHAFPTPYIDWYYLTRRLKQGGIIIIDDVQLWSCRVLVNFLDEEPGWQKLVRTKRFAGYRLMVEPAEVVTRPWVSQPYITSRSRELSLLGSIHEWFRGRSFRLPRMGRKSEKRVASKKSG